MKPACKPSVVVVSSKTSPRWVYMWLLFRRLFVLGPCTFRPFNIFGSLLLDKEQKTVKTDALFCFPVLNISNEQTVLVSNISFSTFSQFCTVNNCLCSWKTPKCPKFTRKSKDTVFRFSFRLTVFTKEEIVFWFSSKFRTFGRFSWTQTIVYSVKL